MLLEDDNPLVRYSGAVSANILPMDKTTELVIPCLAAGKTIFLIVSHLPAPRANELIRNSSGTASNACWIVRIKIGKITIKIVNAPANNDLPLDPPFAIPNVWIKKIKPNIPNKIEGVAPSESIKNKRTDFPLLF